MLFRLSVRYIYTSGGSVHRVFCVDVSISVNSPWPLKTPSFSGWPPACVARQLAAQALAQRERHYGAAAAGIWSLASPAKPG